MKKSLSILKEIIDLIPEYDKETNNENANIASFTLWLNDRVFESKVGHDKKMVYKDFNNPTNHKADQSDEVLIATFIARMFRFAKQYSKKALENTNLKTIDDFGFLSSLIVAESMTKTELINRHVLEITTGMEIIKRLHTLGFIEEFKDSKDGRTKRVRITDLGRETTITAFEKMNKVSHIVSGNLTDKEKSQMVSSLGKLKSIKNLKL
jgi:MarR family transcriptional regulator, lower aerobic nicotinate degradation pathway regulator